MNQQAIIQELEVIGSTFNDRTAHRKLRHVLERLDLRPEEMPAEAILCVRHFHDPAPGVLPLQATQRGALRQWQRAARSELTRLYRRAYAPVRQTVPVSAEAVVFHDTGEWLVCITRDWLNGHLLGRWWWQHWLKNQTQSRVIERAWVSHPMYLPQTMSQLTTQERVTFVQQVSPATVQHLTQQLVQTFGIVSSVLDDDTSPVEDKATDGQQRVADRDAAGYQRGTDRDTGFHVFTGGVTASTEQQIARTASIDLNWIPELSLSSLTTTQQRFLIIAMSLIRQPRLVRQKRFATMMQNYLYRTSTTSKTASQSQVSAPPSASVLRDEQHNTSIENEGYGIADSIVTTAESGIDTISVHTAQQAKLSATADKLSNNENTAAIETDFGGLFYMVNMVLYLGIYADFSASSEIEMDLPLWDFLALLGDLWFGQIFRDDRLWEWLALMADRPPQQLPGEDIPAPDTWQLAPHGLRAFPEAALLRWRTYRGRLIVWHPAGFHLIDVPRRNHVDDQLKEALNPYANEFELVQDDSLFVRHEIGWSRWFNWLLPYLEARLRRAFAGETHPAVLLCRYPATIRRTQTHINVHFRLDDINLAVRWAGLDRNPGWVPSVGHSIAFHFE